MSRVDAHSVTLHRVVDLIDDRLSGSLDTKHLCDLDDVVGGSLLADNALGGHDFLQAVPLDKKFFVALLPAMVIILLDVDDSTTNSGHTL